MKKETSSAECGTKSKRKYGKRERSNVLYPNRKRQR